MSIWQKAKVLITGEIDIDAGGSSWVRILSPKFGDTVAYVGYGIDLIFGGVESASSSYVPTYHILGF